MCCIAEHERVRQRFLQPVQVPEQRLGRDCQERRLALRYKDGWRAVSGRIKGGQRLVRAVGVALSPAPWRVRG